VNNNQNEELKKELATRLLLTDNDLVEARLEIRKALVITILNTYPLQFIVDAEKIKDRLFSSFGCELSRGEIAAILEELASSEELKHLKKYEYRIVKKFFCPPFSDVTSEIWKSFTKYLTQTDLDSTTNLDQLKTIFESLLIAILMEISKTSSEMKYQHESLDGINFQKIIEDKLESSPLRHDKKRITKSFLDYINSRSPEFDNFFSKYYILTSYCKIIQKEDSIPNGEINKIIPFIILDTSVLVPLLCTTNHAYSLIHSTIRKCKKSSVSVYYTNETEKELDNLIIAANTEMSLFQRGKDQPIIQNPFVKDCLDLTTPDDTINWLQYYKKMREWRDFISTEDLYVIRLPEDKKIKIDENVAANAKQLLPLFRTFQYSNPKTKRYNVDYYSPHKDEHDAYCLGLIHALRKNLNNKTEYGPLFVTSDNAVTLVDEVDNRTLGRGNAVIQPRYLFDYFILHSMIKFKKDKRKEVSETILKYIAAQSEKKMSVELYSRLLSEKLGLANKEQIEILKKIIYHHPLKNQIKKAIEDNSGGDLQNLIITIFSDNVGIQTIFDIEATKQRLKEISSDKMELKEKNIQLEKTVQELQRKISELVSSTESQSQSIPEELDLPTSVSPIQDNSNSNKGNGNKKDNRGKFILYSIIWSLLIVIILLLVDRAQLLEDTTKYAGVIAIFIGVVSLIWRFYK